MPACILVIEDNPANLDLMCYLLKASGYATLSATNGREGLETVRRERPDLVICDVQMPEMNGYEFARAMSADEEHRHIPLLAVTAFAMVGDREKTLEAGFDAYAAKPINPEDFLGLLAGLLEAAPRRSRAPGRTD